MPWVRWRGQRQARRRLELAMPVDTQRPAGRTLEHRAAQHDRIKQRTVHDVLDDPRQVVGRHQLPTRRDQVGPVRPERAFLETLAGPRGVDRVEGLDERPVAQYFEPVRLEERERIAGLWVDIDTDDVVEPRTAVAHGRAAGAAGEIEQLHGQAPWSGRQRTRVLAAEHRGVLSTPVS